MSASGDEKNSNKKMAKGVIIAGLVVYIVLGAAAIGLYYYDTTGIRERSEAAQRVREAAAALPERSNAAEAAPESAPADEDYDVQDGTAGAARDF